MLDTILHGPIPAAPATIALFALLSLAAIAGALVVIIARDPFVSALSLIINFVSLGALYLMLHAPFVALSQVLVYAGAVIVLFLFVIAYLGDRREIGPGRARATWLRPAGAIAALAFALVGVVVAIGGRHGEAARLVRTPQGRYDWGSASAIGEVFLTRYVLVFEVTSLVLLVAAIGGISLGLTGRARHDRLRKLMRTRSADQQRRWYEEQERSRRPGEQASRETEGAGR